MAARTTALLLATLLMTIPASAQTPAPLRHTLRFPAPQSHLVDVTTVVPGEGRSDIELMMPVWTPGSYLIREYERNVEGFSAVDPAGRPLPVVKSAKNRWRISSGGASAVTVSYRVYGREMTPRTNWIDASFAIINGAPTFMTIAGDTSRPHEVVVEPPSNWKTVASPLAEAGSSRTFRASSFDELVDSPMLLGNPDVRTFQVGGKTISLVTEGGGAQFDAPRAAQDLAKVVETHRAMWGSLPFDRYVFFNLLTLPAGQGGGALEHASSVVMLGDRSLTKARQSYVTWLELASHEFFHAWNIKRLRPVELGPFDYERENHTKSLWLAEGVTDYYGDLAVHRAGLSTPDEYLQNLSSKIDEIQNTPGRFVQSVEQASFDAWIRFYRPDENSVNVSISYYTKGHVIGLLLDARIRALTKGARSLDDVMRLAFARYSGVKGYTPDEFRAVAEDVAGASLKDFWTQAIEGTAELNYGEALETLGLRFRPTDATGVRRAWIGVSLRNDNGRLLVSQVRRETPGAAAGLNVDDEILAIDDTRVRADRIDARLAQYAAGDRVTLLIARREQFLQIPLTFGAEPDRRWRLERHPAPTDAQRQAHQSWVGH